MFFVTGFEQVAFYRKLSVDFTYVFPLILSHITQSIFLDDIIRQINKTILIKSLNIK